ncbi:hypothetical protein cyc_02998 [Cyclospora cayetanensis]|uniref:Uncharacterized protein n=1 Tax=Cyclospora cayetanensis TaxID=88456 RepID=A0A1D3CXG8_9EIME|nr:hypothetical protein cyc_02998 [Cyclospora cayetanensis]
MMRQALPLVLFSLTFFWGRASSTASAGEPDGIIPTQRSPGAPTAPDNSSPQPTGAQTGKKAQTKTGLENNEEHEPVLVSAGSAHKPFLGRFSSTIALQDFMHARQASVDGLVALQYSVYLTHALILSSAEMAAHDLKRMPLHRFGAPLTPDQVVEVPLSTVGGLRPFHLFVLFTFVEGHTEGVAEQLSKQCKDCAAAIKTFRKVSKAYKLSDSEPGNDDLFPVIFGVVNVGTRDGAAISAIHPAMQLPVALYLPPTFSSSVENRRDRSSSSSGVSTTVAAEDKAVEAEVDRGSLHVALHKITSAEFFTETLGEWEEDAVLRDLLLQQQKQGIHGKVHFFSVPQNHLLLLQRRKNEASPEQKLLEWVNAHTSRHVSTF